MLYVCYAGWFPFGYGLVLICSLIFNWILTFVVCILICGACVVGLAFADLWWVRFFGGWVLWDSSDYLAVVLL